MKKTTAYKYLFPFEKIPAGSRILIYGAGFLGQEYLTQLLITGYCSVVGFVDRNYKECLSLAVPVFPPQHIREISFDFIVIAVRDGFALPDICKILLTQGIEKSRIVYVLERLDVLPNIFQENFDQMTNDITLSYEICDISIAVYLAGGFGDMICHKRFLCELMKFVPEMKIDIYTQQNSEYIQWLYSDCKWLKNILSDAEVYYNVQKSDYSVAIAIFGPKFLRVDNIRMSNFSDEQADFLSRIIRLQNQSYTEYMAHSIPSAIPFYRRKYNSENCYTWFNYGNVFCIKDWRVKIPFIKKYFHEFHLLNLSKYITVNVGNGSSSGDKDIAKAWPLEYFQETICKFKKKYSDIEIVQIGAAGEPCLEEVDCYLMGKHFGLIAYVLKNAIFHLDIEGGLVHLASQIGTKCIVLFGPTLPEYFGYAENVNIREGSCYGCAGLYPSVDKCARDMQKPECMYSITPEIVMEKMDEYLLQVFPKK